nr:CE1759 family FMN reductase [Aeromicrobium sp. CFBP 8757]
MVSAGISDPSSTRLLGDRLVDRLTGSLAAGEGDVDTQVIELAPLAVDIAQALVGGLHGDNLATSIARLAQTDVLVVSTPVYKAGISGLLKSFVDVLDNDLLVGKPVLLASTAGSARHAMVADDHLRPLFAFMRCVVAPTSVFAAPEDWADPATSRRIERAAHETAVLWRADTERAISDSAWGSYQHQFGGQATRSEQSGDDVDFDTALMRLATGRRPRDV